jgi:hypothetical protein
MQLQFTRNVPVPPEPTKMYSVVPSSDGAGFLAAAIPADTSTRMTLNVNNRQIDFFILISPFYNSFRWKVSYVASIGITSFNEG